MQMDRLAAARQAADRALLHPALCDELFGDRRHRAALQSRLPRKIGARHRLVLADQVQENAAIDVASGLAGGYLKIVEVDLSHGGRVCYICSRCELYRAACVRQSRGCYLKRFKWHGFSSRASDVMSIASLYSKT